MMRPTKLSSKVFLELPPVLAHYLEGARNVWIESLPGKGKLSLLNRPGIFLDLETMAVERRQLVEMLGRTRARALRYRMGFEQGRRDAARHYAVYAQNARLALQAGPVFGQLQGRYVVEPVTFEYDLEERTLYRELVLQGSTEGLSHRMAFEDGKECACWTVAGYLSGQVSEILGRHVVTVESECCAKGDPACRFVSKLESEWGPEAAWVRQALLMESFEADSDPPAGPATAAPKMDIPPELNDSAEGNGHASLESETPAPEPEVPEPVELEVAVAPPEPDPVLEGLVASSEGMQAVSRRLRSLRNADIPVLLVGEPGTGRQTLARRLHKAGPRAEAPFLTVDCTGLPPERLSYELFGYVAGAFPGAVRDHVGALARAHGGTVYLDEVGQLNKEAQGLLLRALEERTIVPFGASEAVPADVRLIAATERDPADLLSSGELRQELYYALNVASIVLPPLRDRGADVLRLAEAFLQDLRARYDKPRVRLTDDVKPILMDCSWPGNIRQLRNVLEHAVVMGDGRDIRIEDLPEDILAARWKRPPQDLGEQVIRAALKRTNGNRSQAAELLGVGRTTLWRAMKRLGME